MDLIEKGHRPAAARLLNGWLERTVDYAGLALLPLFLSLRAAIRAKVLGLAAMRDPNADLTSHAATSTWPSVSSTRRLPSSSPSVAAPAPARPPSLELWPRTWPVQPRVR